MRLPPISKYDIEIDLDDLNEIHQEFKYNFYPNYPFPYSADVSLDNNWSFEQENFKFNIFYVD